jgi:transposase
MGNKSKVNEWLTDDVKRTLLSGWVRNGLANDQLAKNMEISLSTFYKWQNDSSEFSELLKRDKDYADTHVENALYKAAMEGNTTAQIFWLKNRRRNNWKDKQDVEVSGEVGIVDAMIRKANERKERLENDS